MNHQLQTNTIINLLIIIIAALTAIAFYTLRKRKFLRYIQQVAQQWLDTFSFSINVQRYSHSHA